MQAIKLPWRTGNSYKDGKYYAFRKKDIRVITSWPNPRGYRKTKTKAWMHTRRYADEVLCEMNMLLPEEDQARAFLNTVKSYITGPDDSTSSIYENFALQIQIAEKGIEAIFSTNWHWDNKISEDEIRNIKGLANKQITEFQYLKTIPRSVREILNPLKERRWQMMNLLARCPGSDDLATTNPALAFALANNWAFHLPAVTQPYRSARAMLKKKRREIALWLGFHSQSGNLLSKISPEALSIIRLLGLRKLTHDKKARKILSHLQTINGAVIDIAVRHGWLERINPILLNEISIEHDEYFVSQRARSSQAPSRLIKNIFFLEHQLQILPETRRQRKFNNKTQLENYHNELLQFRKLFIRHDLAFDAGNAFVIYPAPPFPGNEEIIPIKDVLDLRKEGMEMEHCVASHSLLVAQGSHYVYSVHQPVRATLSIKKTYDGWVIDEMKGVRNFPIDSRIQEQCFQSLLETVYLFSTKNIQEQY